MKAKYRQFGTRSIRLLLIISAACANIMVIHSAFSKNVFDDDVSGTYQHYDGESKLNIKPDGSFTIVVKTKSTVILGSWKENDKTEILFILPNTNHQNKYQIYGGHLFQNGYLVWRKHG